MPKPNRRKSPFRAQRIKRSLSTPPPRSSLANTRQPHSSSSAADGLLKLRILLCAFCLIFSQLPVCAQSKNPDTLDILTSPLVIGFTPSQELKQLLIHELLQAKERIDIAMFNLSDPDLINTLAWVASQRKRRSSPPVQVRLLVDDWGEQEPISHDTLEMLTHLGVQVHLHKSEGKNLLHMKTAVVDQKVLLTGAANWSRMAFWRNIEDILIFRDERIAKIYHDRIDQLATKIPLWQIDQSDRSARSRLRKIPAPSDPARLLSRDWQKKAAGSGQIKAFPLPPAENITIGFTPEQPFVPGVVELINNTHHTITAAFYLFSHHHIQEPMIARVEQLDIEILLDEVTFRLNPIFVLRCQKLHDAGVKLWRCKETGENDSMHLKAAVFDDATTWRGSANWSINANASNYEEYSTIQCQNVANFYTGYINSLRTNTCEKY